MKSEDRSKILQFADNVKQCLQNIDEEENYELSYEYFEEKKNLNVPLINHGKSNTSFVFRTPTDVQIVGSFLTDTYVKRDLTVDLLVTIPKKCFHERDYLNQKYFEKCALYLAFVAFNLKKSFGDSVEFQYSYFNGIHLKPVLLMRNSNLSFCSFRLIVAGEPCCFKRSRFLPSTSNIRYNWFYGKEGEEFPTPYYNSLILQDLSFSAINEYFVSNVENNEELKQVIVSIKIWLKQRSYSKSVAVVMSMFAFYLINEKKISKYMNCFTLFRNILFHFSVSDLENQAITLSSENPVQIEKFTEMFDTVFLDPSGFFNLCFDLHSHIYKSLKHEASLTVQYIDKSSPNVFEAFLMKPVLFNEKFDAVVLIKNGGFSQSVVSHMEIEDRFLDCGGDIIKTCIPPIINIINYGWGHRFLLVKDDHSSNFVSWELSECPPSATEVSKFTKLGFLFNSEHILDTTDRGPSADKPDAEDFKLYWEELSDLRRFQDGDVCEAVYWKASSVCEKRHIFKTAVKHILQRKSKISPNRFYFPGYGLENYLRLNGLSSVKKTSDSTGEEMLQDVLTVFDNLSKMIRKLQELPLEVSRIQGISPTFRGSEIFPPLSTSTAFRQGAFKVDKNMYSFIVEHDYVPHLIEPLEVVLHFETTGKWPNDLGAIRRLKAAVHIDLARQLKSSFGIRSKVNPEFVDVYYEGYIFRLIVCCYKEVTLMRTIKNEDGVLCKVDCKQADELEMRIDILPKLTSSLYSLHLKYPSFNTACRLAKRWITSQMFTDHLNDVTVELIVAYLYINPFPYSVPNSPFVCFVRFLSLIATFDWKHNPLIVNLNEELSDEKMSEITEKFSSDRAQLPSMFVTSPYDKHLSMWTCETPSLPVLKQLKKVASTAKEILDNHYNSRGEDYSVIFRPPIDVFDIIIHLKTNAVANIYLDKDNSIKTSNFKPFDKTSKNVHVPIIDFNPVKEYVKQLRQTYHEVALFFYDKLGGNVIGVILKPAAFETRDDDKFFSLCKLAEVSSSDGSRRFEVNFEALIEDFSVLGDSIVEKVEIINKQWIQN